MRSKCYAARVVAVERDRGSDDIFKGIDPALFPTVGNIQPGILRYEHEPSLSVAVVAFPAGPFRRKVSIMPAKPHISLRINLSPSLYERVSAYRHEAKHESRGQALVCLVAAGLAALSRPAVLPPTAAEPETPPVRSSKLVAYAGAPSRYRAQ